MAWALLAGLGWGICTLGAEVVGDLHCGCGGVGLSWGRERTGLLACDGRGSVMCCGCLCHGILTLDC